MSSRLQGRRAWRRQVEAGDCICPCGCCNEGPRIQWLEEPQMCPLTSGGQKLRMGGRGRARSGGFASAPDPASVTTCTLTLRSQGAHPRHPERPPTSGSLVTSGSGSLWSHMVIHSQAWAHSRGTGCAQFVTYLTRVIVSGRGTVGLRDEPGSSLTLK